MALVNLDLGFNAAQRGHGFEGKRDAVLCNILLSGLELPCTCDVQCVAVVSVLTLGAFYLNGKCFAFSRSLSPSSRPTGITATMATHLPITRRAQCTWHQSHARHACFRIVVIFTLDTIKDAQYTAWCKKFFPLFEIPASFLPSKMASPCTANWP